MKYRKLDEAGDMTFGAGSQNFLVNSPDTVAQAVMTVLKLLEGEWFIDVTAGIPYSTQVLGFGNTQNYAFIIKQAILGTLGVVSLEAFSSFVDSNRRANISVTLNTIYGSTILQATL